MSTEGVGTVVFILGAPVVIAVGAAVGAGILVGQGVVWCGKQLKNNYIRDCNQWTAMREAAHARSHAQVEEVSSYFAAQLDNIAYQSVNAFLPQSASRAEQEALAGAIAQAHNALDDTKNVVWLKTEAERELLVHRLKSEIESGRGILPPKVISAMEAAVGGSLEAMRSAISALQSAWDSVTEAQAQRTRQHRQAQQLLNVIITQLNAIDTTRQGALGFECATYIEQRQAIEARVKAAIASLDTDPAKALASAEVARKEVRALSDVVFPAMLKAWEQTRSQMNTLQGILTTLAKMVDEAVSVGFVDTAQANTLRNRISAAGNEAQALMQVESLHVRQRLVRLTERVELIKQDVFTVVEVKQQHRIAQTIVTTLAELGFQSSVGVQPTLQENGDILRIEAIRSGGTPNFERDDKVVSFDVSLNGDVAYDFSGYVGDSCIHEAERIFTALRTNGIFILNTQAADRLQQLPMESVTPDTLAQAHFQLRFIKNKSQAELAERIKYVLEQMNYSTIRQNAIGGCIELEAFNGSIGYRVVLPPEGSAQVFKDASHTDVSTDMHDPVVASVHPQVEQELSADSTQEKPRSTYMSQQKQHKLGN